MKLFQLFIIVATFMVFAAFALMSSDMVFAQTYYLNATFKTDDLTTFDAASKIGKEGWNDEFAIFHQITGDLEIGYLQAIKDLENGYSICTFKYEEDKYRKDLDVFEINSWVESLDSTKKLIRSLPGAKIIAVEK